MRYHDTAIDFAAAAVLIGYIAPLAVTEVFIRLLIAIVVDIVAHFVGRNKCPADPAIESTTLEEAAANSKLVLFAAGLANEIFVYLTIALVVDTITVLGSRYLGAAIQPACRRIAFFIAGTGPELVALLTTSDHTGSGLSANTSLTGGQTLPKYL